MRVRVVAQAPRISTALSMEKVQHGGAHVLVCVWWRRGLKPRLPDGQQDDYQVPARTRTWAAAGTPHPASENRMTTINAWTEVASSATGGMLRPHSTSPRTGRIRHRCGDVQTRDPTPWEPRQTPAGNGCHTRQRQSRQIGSKTRTRRPFIRPTERHCLGQPSATLPPTSQVDTVNTPVKTPTNLRTTEHTLRGWA